MRPIATDEVAWSVGLSVCNENVSTAKQLITNRDAVSDVDSGGPTELRYRLDPDLPRKGALLRSDDVGIFPNAVH